MLNAMEANKLPQLVIFDKDGTLIDFNSTWTPWVTSLATSLETQGCDFDVATKLYKVVGYCDKTDTVSDSSLLAYASMDEMKEEIKLMLLESGVSRSDVDDLLRKCWTEGHVNSISPSPTTDLVQLFTCLHQAGIKIAVCTSDSRASTEAGLKKLRVAHLVDAVVCADDENMESKPSPKGVLKICADLGKEPSDTVVIGDTTFDMMMAKSAGVGRVVGVLTGIGTKKELSKFADVVIENVETIATLFNEPTFFEAEYSR